MDALTSDDLLLGFYGDDFTGSTDAMEGLAGRACGRAVLGPPRPTNSADTKNLRAVGVAVVAGRCLRRRWAKLGSVFSKLNELQLPIVPYKVCSTFDSSPRSAGIGRALDIGADLVATPVVPLCRSSGFWAAIACLGNLFARSGMQSEPSRLDRHPTWPAPHPP